MSEHSIHGLKRDFFFFSLWGIARANRVMSLQIWPLKVMLALVLVFESKLSWCDTSCTCWKWKYVHYLALNFRVWICEYRTWTLFVFLYSSLLKRFKYRRHSHCLKTLLYVGVTTFVRRACTHCLSCSPFLELALKRISRSVDSFEHQNYFRCLGRESARPC